MKTLYLLRHAKSDWGGPGLEDHERPLNARGREAARRMGRHIAGLQPQPALVLCSSSVRTRETWALLGAALPDQPAIGFESGLYLASPRDILACINRIEDEPEAALVIGHNPGMEDLAQALPAGGDRAAMERVRTKYPTAALATFTFDCRWRDLDFGLAELNGFVRPKDLS
ncbi:MAG: histidine phosphatase family protein [Acetobacterales bacterium]